MPAIAGGQDISKKVLLTVRGKEVDEPLVYTIGHKFNVVTNIHGASVADGVGIVALELTGPKEEVEKALKFVEEKNITIETLE